MARRIREEYIDDPEPVRHRRVVTERHYGGPVGYWGNPAVMLVAALLLVPVLLLLVSAVR